MNCKPGDLALVVRSILGNEGKVVRCIRWSEKWPGVWVIDRPIGLLDGCAVSYAPDWMLRPIRDPGDDAQDETLSWLPVPSTEKEAA